jgi:hypothetical protein
LSSDDCKTVNFLAVGYVLNEFSLLENSVFDFSEITTLYIKTAWPHLVPRALVGGEREFPIHVVPPVG